MISINTYYVISNNWTILAKDLSIASALEYLNTHKSEYDSMCFASKDGKEIKELQSIIKYFIGIRMTSPVSRILYSYSVFPKDSFYFVVSLV